MTAQYSGRVAEFDDHRGLRRDRGATAGCGSRSTAPPSPTAPARSPWARRCEFRLVIGPLGALEAAAVSPAD